MHRTRHDERGTGIIGTALGAVVFVAFMALATHVLVGLYASSVVSSVAWDDARRIAVHPDDFQQAEAAQVDARQRLRGFKDVDVDVSRTGSDVVFHVSAHRPNLLPAGMLKKSAFNRIDKTVHVRSEAWQ